MGLPFAFGSQIKDADSLRQDNATALIGSDGQRDSSASPFFVGLHSLTRLWSFFIHRVVTIAASRLYPQTRQTAHTCSSRVSPPR